MRTFLLVLMLSIVHFVLGQTPESPSNLTKEHYLEKAKTQKTWSGVLGFTGLGVLTAGMIMTLAELEDGFSNPSGSGKGSTQMGETLAYIGGGLIIISLPLQFAYKRNQKISASIAVENRRIWMPQQEALTSRFHPSLSLELGLIW